MARIHFLQDPPVNIVKHPSRLHPLTAAAAVSVITVSLVGVGVLTGIVPDLRAANVVNGAKVTQAPVGKLAADQKTRVAAVVIPSAPASVSPAEALAPGETLVPVDALKAPPQAVATRTSSASVMQLPPTVALRPTSTIEAGNARTIAPPVVTPARTVTAAATAIEQPALSPTHRDVPEHPGVGRSHAASVAVVVPEVPRHRHASAPLTVAGRNPVGPAGSSFSGGLGSGSSSAGSGSATATGTRTREVGSDFSWDYAPAAGQASGSQASAADPNQLATPAPAPKITPVLRPPIPLDAPAGAYTVNGPQGDRYQSSRYQDNRSSSNRYQANSDRFGGAGGAQSGTGARIGGVLGSTVGEGIDRTLSALAGVLGGRRTPAPPVQDFPLDQTRYQARDPQRDQPYANGAYER